MSTEAKPVRSYLKMMLIMASDVTQHSRKTYGLLDVFGDFGGLNEVVTTIFFVILAPWVQFNFNVKALQKLYNVKTKKHSKFRRSNSTKYLSKMKKLDKEITTPSDREQMKFLHLGKLNTFDSLSLFFRDCFGCLPE